MRFLQEAAINFVHKLEDVDTALVVQFNESIKGSAEFTGDIDRLEQFVDALQAWGGTSLNDAIHYGLEPHPRPDRAQGAWSSSPTATTPPASMKEQEVVDYARAVEATVYTRRASAATSGWWRAARAASCARSRKETGGEFFFPERVGDLVKVFPAISDELHQHYALAYAPSARPTAASATIR